MEVSIPNAIVGQQFTLQLNIQKISSLDHGLESACPERMFMVPFSPFRKISG
jgi:hypothetical protein